jgi:membrane-associated protease RseP (regulator of RpoE activity)
VLYTIGVIAFAVGLLASIALHELGHMMPAKKFGVKVTQYMVGFGPTLWSKHKGDTEYGLKAIPLGGYIRMIGMVPPRKDGSRSRWPTRMATLVEEFRATSRTEVTPDAEDRQFYKLTPGKKIIVMLGGPTMNLLIFFVITVLLYGVVGVKGPTTTIGSVSDCVVTAAAQTEAACPSPASNDYRPAPANGVLKPGDKITAINGSRVTSWDDAVTVIEASANKTLTLGVIRDGKPLQLTITPVLNSKYANAAGTQTKQAGFIGVSPTETYQQLSAGRLSSVVWQQMTQGLDALGKFPSKVGSLFGTVFEGKPRDQQGAVGVVGLGRIGGEIADSTNVATKDKISTLLSLLAGVNLLLFFFNLLPLLPLDGGHVAGALVEAFRRGRARLKHRRHATVGPDGAPVPRPERAKIYVDVAQMVPVMYVVASILIVFSVLVMYADIVKPISIN